MNIPAWAASATALAIAASGVSASVLRFHNTGGQFDWRFSIDGDTTHATWLDITQPASQSGFEDLDSFGLRRFTGFSTPHFNEDRLYGVTADAKIVRRDAAIFLQDEEGIDNAFGFARSFAPETHIGPGMNFQQSAHIAVTNFYTSPLIERTLPTGFVGVSVLKSDGVHYGWIQMAAVENPGGVYIEYDLVAWAYETAAGVPIVVPAPSAGMGLLGMSLCGLARRRRAA